LRVEIFGGQVEELTNDTRRHARGSCSAFVEGEDDCCMSPSSKVENFSLTGNRLVAKTKNKRREKGGSSPVLSDNLHTKRD